MALMGMAGAGVKMAGIGSGPRWCWCLCDAGWWCAIADEADDGGLRRERSPRSLCVFDVDRVVCERSLHADVGRSIERVGSRRKTPSWALIRKEDVTRIIASSLEFDSASEATHPSIENGGSPCPHPGRPTPHTHTYKTETVMAAAWRPTHDPLRQHLAAAAMDFEEDAESPSSSGRAVADDEEEEEKQATTNADAQADATTTAAAQWCWARWRGRLARHGILVHMPTTAPAPTPQHQHPPPAGSLLRAVLRYQLTARAAIRQLQGALALLCGRGVAVPMPPLAALGGLGAVEEAEAHCPALPALRAALVGWVCTPGM